MKQRLLSCAGLVERGNVAADVGTDHGYLAIHLLETGICPFVYASDLREGPLAAARRSAQRAGLRENIEFVLSDGLARLPMERIRTVICAGMGGDNIIAILGAEPAVKDPAVQLVLQPQSKAPELRRWLGEEGFAIRREALSQDGQFIYTALEARYDGVRRSLSPGEQWMPPWLLSSGDPLLRAYYERVRDGIERTVAGLGRARDPDPALLQYYQTVLRALKEMEGDIHDSK